jgi:hypothetical protein
MPKTSLDEVGRKATRQTSPRASGGRTGKSGVVCAKRPSRYSWPHASQRTHAFRSLFGVKSLAKQFRKTYIGHLEQLYGKGELDFYGKTTLKTLPA